MLTEAGSTDRLTDDRKDTRALDTAMFIFRVIFYFLLIVAIGIFASQNMDMVPVYLLVGPPVEVPLIVVVVMAFIVGYGFALLAVVFRAAKGGRRRSASRNKELMRATMGPKELARKHG